MRSRYSAYALHKARYILDTTHPDGPHHRVDADAWRREVLAFCKSTRFDGLDVESVEDGAGVGFVSFVARLSQDGRPAPLRERSEFRRDTGRWLYYGADETSASVTQG